MKKLLPILGLSLGLTTAANANDKPFAVGDVFFCEMLANVEYSFSEKRLKNYILEKFKFTISSEKAITFGQSSNTFKDLTLYIEMLSDDLLLAKSNLEDLSVHKNGEFTYTFNLGDMMVAAQCDRF